MSWFHLSISSFLERIEKTNSPDSPSSLKPWVPAWIGRLNPDDPYQEPDNPPRVSVSPSVWQCVSALGRDDGEPSGDMHIYEVHTACVAAITFGPTLETEISDEHWVTDIELDRQGGTVELSRLGWMQVEDVFSELRFNYRPYEVLDRMKSLAEIGPIWTVTKEDGDSRWRLNLKGLAQIRERP